MICRCVIYVTTPDPILVPYVSEWAESVKDSRATSCRREVVRWKSLENFDILQLQNSSSGRENLRDELHKADCDTALWSDDGRSQSSRPRCSNCLTARQRSNSPTLPLSFSSKTDLKVTETNDPLRCRDTYDFQAGLFMAKIGRERCFLVNSIGDSALPSHIGGGLPAYLFR